MGDIKDYMVKVDADKLNSAIMKSGITKGKLSRMILNRDQSYLSNVSTKAVPTMNEADLKKLCEFLDLNMNDLIIEETPKVVKTMATPKDVVNLDALILGINQLYQEVQVDEANKRAV